MFGLREKIYQVVFETDTNIGKAVDIILFLSIIGSIAVVLLDSIDSIRQVHGDFFWGLEWTFTILFSFEYILRLLVSPRPACYAFSFFGFIDFLSIVPTYVCVLFWDDQSLIVIRAIRLLRVFRVLKLGRFLGEGEVLLRALWVSRFKITVFMGGVLSGVLIIGTIMFIVEGPENGFNNIPEGMYWTVVTLTTVGYGDLAPVTPFGRFLASLVMIMGNGVIAVPTGIVSAELAVSARERLHGRACQSCHMTGHKSDATYCRGCGSRL